MAKFSIEFADRSYGLVSRYAIPKYLVRRYVSDHSIIRHPEGVQLVGKQSHCDLCLRDKDDTVKQTLTVCQRIDINRAKGHPAKICLECYYFLEFDSGNEAIPISFKSIIKQGFKPRGLDNLLYL